MYLGARQFTMSFRVNNAAFEGANEPYEIARILRKVATEVVAGAFDGDVRDENGNKVGEWSLDEPPEPAECE